MGASLSPASTIAIDGPAASGKSTLARHLARRLGYLYFDTGVMYRAATLAAIRQGLDLMDEQAVTNLAERITIDVQPKQDSDETPFEVLLDGEDVTSKLRAPEIDTNVSRVSAYRGVRRAMTGLQRAIGMRGNVVMVGRDIGTVVLTDADVKLYLDATVEARAHRRFNECLDRGEDIAYKSVLESMKVRDAYDSSREVAPLRPANDAVVLDTTDLSIEEMVETALILVKKHTAKNRPSNPV
jgi:cytidylate kinase